MATEEEIAAKMTQPRRIKGDQGEVENRSVGELIMFDNWQKQKQYCRRNILQASVQRVSRYITDC